MAPNSVAIGRALRLIEAHNAVVSIKLEENAGASDVLATVEIETELPSDWRSAGQSPSGVKRVEPISFRFGPDYPVFPPQFDCARTSTEAIRISSPAQRLNHLSPASSLARLASSSGRGVFLVSSNRSPAGSTKRRCSH